MRKKTGNGIATLLTTYGGVGVADFTCMGSITSALATLPTGTRTDVTINGQTVSLGESDVTLAFTPLQRFAPPPGDGAHPSGPHISDFRLLVHGGPEERGGPATEGGLSFHVVPTGKGNAMMVGTYTAGDMFASLAAGTRDDFFGFTEGHENGVREERFTAGHVNAFAYFSRVRSRGGRFIESAVGQATGLMVRKNFNLTERVSLAVSAQAERFLGGRAKLGSYGVSFGGVELQKGGWHHRLNADSKIVVDGARTLNLSAELRSPDGGDDELALGARFDWRF